MTPAQILERSGLVIVDKPAGMTSHDVVGRLRRFFGTRKVGHAGTLDPMATGVLVAGIERGTKFLTFVTGSDKTYATTIALGVATSTDDAEGEVISTADPAAVETLSQADILSAIGNFRGQIMQRPSSVSAIKVAGQRAYERVRQGEEVVLPERPVTIHSYEVGAMRREEGRILIDAVVHCSSGTYIRALARDLGAALGVGGHLIALRRLSVGGFDLSHARTLEQLEQEPTLSLTLDQALPLSYPTVQVTAQEAADLAMGKWLSPRGLAGIHAAVGPDGKAIALVKESGSRLATVFVARPSTMS